MPREGYVAEIRELVGTRPLLLPAVTVFIREEDADDGALLMGRHRDTGRWVFPGGAMEPLETPADAAVREAWEETGLVVELTRLAGVFSGEEFRIHYSNGDLVDYVNIIFEARAIGGELLDHSDEFHEMRFVSEAEFDDLDVTPWFRAMKSEPRGWHLPTWSPPR